jgi:ADP-ribosyl-[dinitrogen reductase] hydrolase
MLKSPILSGLMGVAVGDALGVPVEFNSREELKKNPVTSMAGYGTWNQPPGTWSDDTSMTFCLAESLCKGFSLDDIADRFCRWYEKAYWSARGEVFDIGNTTYRAIANLRSGKSPLEAGERGENSNGNGSLMRILPMAFLYQKIAFTDLLIKVHQASSITHAHPRCQIACGIYINIAIELLQEANLEKAYKQGLEKVKEIYQQEIFASEIHHFHRVTRGEIGNLQEDEIRSGGYVIDTLEASLWCLLNTSSYSAAVLKAINLGGDTDTTAAVTGGLAGIYYRVENIPQDWVREIARKEDIVDLANRLGANCALAK